MTSSPKSRRERVSPRGCLLDRLSSSLNCRRCLKASAGFLG